METTFTNSVATVSIDHENKWVFAEWTAAFSPSGWDEANVALVDAFKKSGFNAYLSDNRKAVLLKPEQQERAQTVYGPMLVQAGMRFVAFVQPASIFTKLSEDRLVENVGGIMTISQFPSIESGQNWLREMVANSAQGGN